ncbi:uncharacterized protein LOC109836056 [Asparagus officinalis]|uniref:uncharacterized protein LOC109836056 n=1 Tax=Asparagus officinalis TaxID=4686 RepID=UPI00098E5ED0|nr:uncharacterized protein LOC109836056 [Asparagus officinalis]
MTTRTTRTARGITGAQLGVEGLASFIEMQSGFMERQIEILEKQSEAIEKLSEALNTEKKTKPFGSDFEKFKKMSPPSFQGGSDPTMAQEWLKKMEKYFRALGCSEEQKVIYATFMLEGDAEIWWETKESSLSLEVEDIPWSIFVKLFREKYFPLYV